MLHTFALSRGFKVQDNSANSHHVSLLAARNTNPQSRLCTYHGLFHIQGLDASIYPMGIWAATVAHLDQKKKKTFTSLQMESQQRDDFSGRHVSASACHCLQNLCTAITLTGLDFIPPWRPGLLLVIDSSTGTPFCFHWS